MTATLILATGPSPVAGAPGDAPASPGDVLPADYDYSRDYFPAAPIDFVLLDADLLFTRPPDGAETLSDVIQRIAGTDV